MRKLEKEPLSMVRRFFGLALAKAPADAPHQSLRLEISKPDGQAIHVGTLAINAGRFEFSYSKEFSKSGLPPIPAFPDLAKKYESEALFPFFQTRLPPVSRADVARVMEKNHVEPSDVFGMLKILGSRTVASPYRFSS